MDKKRIASITALFFFLAAGFLFYFTLHRSGQITGGVIGNNSELDEHGCLIHSGYAWNETEQACVLPWINGTGKYQVFDFSSCMEAGYPLSNITITNMTNGQSNKFQQCWEPNGTVFVNGLNLTYLNNNNASLMNLSVGKNSSVPAKISPDSNMSLNSL